MQSVVNLSIHVESQVDMEKIYKEHIKISMNWLGLKTTAACMQVLAGLYDPPRMNTLFLKLS